MCAAEYVENYSDCLLSKQLIAVSYKSRIDAFDLNYD